MSIGVAGYSRQAFDKEKALEILRCDRGGGIMTRRESDTIAEEVAS
jgi:hypothetical protein